MIEEKYLFPILADSNLRVVFPAVKKSEKGRVYKVETDRDGMPGL